MRQLTYAKQGQREFSAFAYDANWLANPGRFEISPDLPLTAGFQARRAQSKADSVFHLALADTAPDAWGRRIIARAHAKQRKQSPHLQALNELDYLAAVDDFSRVGALRLLGEGEGLLRTVEEGKRTTPPLLELEKIFAATRAVEAVIEQEPALLVPSTGESSSAMPALGRRMLTQWTAGRYPSNPAFCINPVRKLSSRA